MAHCRFHLPHRLTCFILVTSYLYSRHPTTDLQALRFSFYYCTISSLLSRPKAGSTPVASILPFFLSFSTSLALYFVAIVNKGIRIGHEFPCLRLFTETVVDNPRHISNHCPSSWTYHWWVANIHNTKHHAYYLSSASTALLMFSQRYSLNFCKQKREGRRVSHTGYDHSIFWKGTGRTYKDNLAQGPILHARIKILIMYLTKRDETTRILN